MTEIEFHELQITVRDTLKIQYVGGWGNDAMVVAAARASNGEGLRSYEEQEDAKYLINSLMKQHHGSPFEHNSMTFYVEAPIFVLREWFRHRIGWSYNEESGRYKKLKPEFWIPQPHRPMVVPEGYKPMRPQFKTLDFDRVEDLKMYRDLVYSTVDLAHRMYDVYEKEIEAGIAKEVARRNLPLNIFSSCWATCNARSLMHFLALRTHDPNAFMVSYPQREIDDAARVMETTFKEQFPYTWECWNKHGRVAP